MIFYGGVAGEPTQSYIHDITQYEGHYTGCLIGIPIIVQFNHHKTG